MTTTINGITFDGDAKTYNPRASFGNATTPRHGGSPKVHRGPMESKELEVVLPVYDSSNPDSDIAKFEGLVEGNSVLLIEASDQKIHQDNKSVYFQANDYDVRRQPGRPTFVLFTMRGYLLGVPIDGGGSAYKQYLLGGRVHPQQDIQEYFPFDTSGRKGQSVVESDGLTQWEQNGTENWTDVKGTWAVKRNDEGLWRLTETTATTDSFTVFDDDTTLSDGVLQAIVKVDDDAADIEIMARVAGNTASDGAYTAQLDFNNDTVRIREKTGDSTFSTLASDTSYTLNPNQWYHVALRLSGSTLGLFIDGELVVTTTDATLTSGRLGVRVNGGSANDAHIRDLLWTNALSPIVPTLTTHQNTASPTQETVDAKWPFGTSEVNGVRVPRSRVINLKEVLS